MFALLAWIPGIARLLLALTTWLTTRKWGLWLVFFLSSAAWAFIEKLIAFAGIMFVSNSLGVSQLLPYVSGPLLGMPSPFPELLALTKIDKAATIILSAVVVKLVSSIKIQRKPGAPGWTPSPGANG